MSLHVDRHGAGRDLVLLHGWGLHGGVWAGSLERLAARFRVHVIDLPGHGHSSATPFEGLDATTDAVAGVLPDAALVCGWSMGGLVAQRLAVRHARKVRALALVASTPCFMQRPDWQGAMREQTLAAFAWGLRTDPDASLRNFVTLNALGGSNTRVAVRELTASMRSRDPPSASALEGGLAMLRETDLRDAAPGIAQPAVVIHGGRDALAPVAAGRWLARHLPNASLVELAGAAHLPFMSHRDDFIKALEDLDG